MTDSYKELKKSQRYAVLMKWDKSELACHSIKYQRLCGDYTQRIRELEVEVEATEQFVKCSWDNDWQQQRIRELEAGLKKVDKITGELLKMLAWIYIGTFFVTLWIGYQWGAT